MYNGYMNKRQLFFHGRTVFSIFIQNQMMFAIVYQSDEPHTTLVIVTMKHVINL